MDTSTRLLWETNIDGNANRVAEINGRETANSVFARYGATSFEDLEERFYGEVFSDLEQLIND
jgi:hypothetical protein